MDDFDGWHHPSEDPQDFVESAGTEVVEGRGNEEVVQTDNYKETTDNSKAAEVVAVTFEGGHEEQNQTEKGNNYFPPEALADEIERQKEYEEALVSQL